jgi:PKD repeat protein
MAHGRLALALLTAVTAAVPLGGCIDPGSDAGIFLRASPNPAEPGETVTFDGRQPPGNTQGYQGNTFAWDLDGNGRFETPGGIVLQQTYPQPGIYHVGLDVGRPTTGPVLVVTLATGIQFFLHDYSTTTLQVVQPPPTPPPGQPQANQPPMAAFTHDADPGYAETPVQFDASGSKDPEGQIVSYEWDFDDPRGEQNTVTTTTPTVSHRYDFSGDYMVKLRVVDAAGLASETTRIVQVVAGTPPSALTASAQAAGGRRGSTFSLTLRPSVLTSEGTATIVNGALVRTGIVTRGRLTLGRRLARPLDRTRKPRWIARFMIKQRGSLGEAQFAVEGQMLLDFGRAGRLCVRPRVTGKRGGRGNGRLSVLGGSGQAARVGGSGTFIVTLPANGVPSVTGRVRLTPRRRARPLPPECRTLLRLSRQRG